MNELLSFFLGMTMQTVFLISLGCIAYAFCQRWFTGSSVGIRWCATCILFCWLLSILFSVLMSLHLFVPLPAVMAGLIGLLLARRSRSKMSPTACAHGLKDDGLRLWEIIAQKDTFGWKIVLTCFLLLSALLTIRTLALPLLGWDSLTYHGVKAGLWVQTMGWKTLNAPGGWEYYRSFFGGGEVFTAWAMLFFHSDLLAGIPDVFFWGLLGLTTTCLARDFGLPVKAAMLVGMAFLCTLDLSRLVGSGYVDTCANSFLLSGLLFLVRFGRSKQPVDLGIAAAAFGLASSVKVNIFAVSILMVVPAIILLLRSRRRPIKFYFLCSLCFAAPVTPWLLFNYITTGYLLGSTPLSIGPIHLGTLPPNLARLLDRPDLTPYKFVAEAHALFNTLRPFGFALVLTVLGVPGILLGVGRWRCEHILTSLLMASVAVFYFSPSFSVARLGWAGVNGRFLVPVIITTAATGLSFLQRFRHGILLIETVSTVAVVIGVWTYLKSFALDRADEEILFLALAVLSVVLVYCRTYWQKLASSAGIAATTALCIVAFVSTLYAFAQFKDSFRLKAYSACTTLHDFPRYWVAGLRALVPESQPRRIAFTYGETKISHGAFMAPFLGGHLENYVFYVSPDKDGIVVPHHPDYLVKAHPSFESWMGALRKAGATHILCLRPQCEELRWIQTHPIEFTKLAGQVNDWGLFRIEWAI